MASMIGASDRTGEFRACALSYQQRVLSGLARPKANKSYRPRDRAGHITTEFLTHARTLATDLNLTQKKFRKLCLHLANPNLTNPSSKSLANLVDVIQYDIVELNRAIMHLRKLENGIPQELGAHSQAFRHNRLITSGLEYRLAELINVFQKTLENNRERMSHWSEPSNSTDMAMQVPVHTVSAYNPPPPPPELHFQTSYTNLQGSCGVRPVSDNAHVVPLYNPNTVNHVSIPVTSNDTRQTVPSSGYSVTSDLYSPSVVSGAPPNSHDAVLFSEQIQLPQVDQEVRQRDATLKRVESTIIQLGEIYQQFSTLVQEQQDVVTRIDSHTETTEINLGFAHEHLVTYLRTVSARRGFMIKVFITILLCFLLFAWLR